MKIRFKNAQSLFFSVIILLVAAAPAQVTTTGRLAGTVTDAQGAIIVDAQVTAKHDQTGAGFKAATNHEGGWSIPSVQNGTYTVTITAPGFKSAVIQAVKVDTGTTATVN